MRAVPGFPRCPALRDVSRGTSCGLPRCRSGVFLSDRTVLLGSWTPFIASAPLFHVKHGQGACMLSTAHFGSHQRICLPTHVIAFDRPELFRGRQAAVPPGPVEEGCVEWLLSPATNSGAGVSLRRTVSRAGSVTPVKELQLVASGHALERTSGPASGYVSTFMDHGCHDRRTCFT